MKNQILKTLLITVLGTSFSYAFAENVNGYTKKNGTYVQGYEKTSPDSYRYNNYGSQSNGGSQRDEYSNGYGATNRSNNSWGNYDNNNNGIKNSYDRNPGR